MSYTNEDQQYLEAYRINSRPEQANAGVDNHGQQAAVRQANADATQAIRLLWFLAAATSLVLSMALARLFL